MSVPDDAPAAFVASVEASGQRIDTPFGVAGAGGTLAWRSWGEDSGAAPVVLAHGAQGAWSHWIRNVGALARRGRVLAFDLPGHGDSAMPETPDHAGMARAIADGLRVILEPGRGADFVGFSMGGVMLAHCAALYPELARRLILVGCGGLNTPHGQVDLRRVAGLTGEERRAVLKSNLLGLMLHHPGTVDDLAIHLLVANARKTRLIDAKLVIPDQLIKVLPEITVPVDAIWGELDRPHPDPPAQEAAIRAVKPDADFRVIADAGHWAMYERAEPFNATLLDMLG